MTDPDKKTREISEEILHQAMHEALSEGLQCGHALGQWALRKEAVVVYPVNVRGLVARDDLTLPHSELAMHVGAAEKKLLAWSVQPDGRYAAVAFERKPGICGFTDGLPNEVLQKPLIELGGRMGWAKKQE